MGISLAMGRRLPPVPPRESQEGVGPLVSAGGWGLVLRPLGGVFSALLLCLLEVKVVMDCQIDLLDRDLINLLI